MTVLSNKLPEPDAAKRLNLGSRRLKEALSSTSWYEKAAARAARAARAADRGTEPNYWKNLWNYRSIWWIHQRNFLQPKR